MAEKKAPEETANEAIVDEPTEAVTPPEEAPSTDAPAAGSPPAEATSAPAAEAPAAEPAEAPAAEAPPEAAEAPAAEAPPEAAEATPSRTKKRLPRSQRHKHSKPAREQPKTRKPIVRGPQPERELGRRQERRGVVVSDKGDKTIVVRVETIRAHPRYKKVVRRSRKFHAHDDQNTAGIGDTVRIVETRPLSKTKHWRLAEIVEKAR